MPWSYAQFAQIFQGQNLPLAYLDLDSLEANAQAALARSGDKYLRLATKSLRCVPVLHHILSLSPRFRGLMAYDLSEALFLYQQGFRDILVAYPNLEPSALQALAKLLPEQPSICLMIDRPEHLHCLQTHHPNPETPPFEVCLDMDLSWSLPFLHFGVQRSALRNDTDWLNFLDAVAQTPQVKLRGCMGYEAQIAGLGDKKPKQILQNYLIRYLKKASIKRLRQKRQRWITWLKNRFPQADLFNGGGTGSLESSAQEPDLTELALGSGLFAPLLFDHYQAFQPQPASGFVLRIVRQPQTHVYTCLGGGYVASGPYGSDKIPQPNYPAGASLLKHEMAGEVQTPVFYQGPETLQIGDPIGFRHAKAGELCEHFNQLQILRQGKIIDAWPTYRGQNQCFLG